MRKLCDILYKITGVIDVILISIIILMTFLQVITRYIINVSIPWAQELVVFSMVWMILLGCSMGIKKQELARLTLLIDKLPPKGQEVMRIVNNSIIIVFLVVVFHANHTVILNAMNRLSGMMRIPMGYVNLSLSVASVLIILYGLVDIYDSLLSLLGKGDGKS